MKRFFAFSVLTLMLLAGAVAVIAAESHSRSRLTISPSEMKDGETKTFTDDGRKITVRREGDRTQVTIEGAGQTRSLSIGSNGANVIIDPGGVRWSDRDVIVTPHGRPRVLIDGMKFNGMNFEGNLPRKSQTWFVCPADHTLMRVPTEKADQTFKCPLDGSTMEKRKSQGFMYFFGDDLFESHEM